MESQQSSKPLFVIHLKIFKWSISFYRGISILRGTPIQRVLSSRGISSFAHWKQHHGLNLQRWRVNGLLQWCLEINGGIYYTIGKNMMWRRLKCSMSTAFQMGCPPFHLVTNVIVHKKSCTQSQTDWGRTLGPCTLFQSCPLIPSNCALASSLTTMYWNLLKSMLKQDIGTPRPMGMQTWTLRPLVLMLVSVDPFCLSHWAPFRSLHGLLSAQGALQPSYTINPQKCWILWILLAKMVSQKSPLCTLCQWTQCVFGPSCVAMERLSLR